MHLFDGVKGLADVSCRLEENIKAFPTVCRAQISEAHHFVLYHSQRGIKD